MTRKELIQYCLKFPSVYEDYPFDIIIDENAWTVMRHLGNTKAFAFIFERKGKLFVNLKCDPALADSFRNGYMGITPAYHMNKIHWNSVEIDSDVPTDLLDEMIRNSFLLTKPGK